VHPVFDCQPPLFLCQECDFRILCTQARDLSRSNLKLEQNQIWEFLGALNVQFQSNTKQHAVASTGGRQERWNLAGKEALLTFLSPTPTAPGGEALTAGGYRCEAAVIGGRRPSM
jgi:hypothetical protein